jgi:Kef-type K+ transport system membrane component KefB
VSSSLLSSLLLLFVALLLARLGSRRLRRWAIPGIVLELLLGFGLGNSVLPFAAIAPLAGLTELGVLTLFFLVGLEVRGGLLGSRPLTVLRTVALSALTPLLAWVPLQQAFGLSTSATLLVMAVLAGLILQELRKLNRPKWRAYYYAPMISEADLPQVVKP